MSQTAALRMIAFAETREQIARCYPVIRELRTHLAEDEFVARVSTQIEQGYRLAFIEVEGDVVACAGYRIGDSLAWGHFLYVDDLVTASDSRSEGHGGALLRWLCEEAHANGCERLHLDSGTERKAAHRFYQREGLAISGFHFVRAL